jgi:hypothetical protein
MPDFPGDANLSCELGVRGGKRGECNAELMRPREVRWWWIDEHAASEAGTSMDAMYIYLRWSINIVEDLERRA